MQRQSLYIILLVLHIALGFSCKQQKPAIKLSGTLLNVSDSIINNSVADTFQLGNIKHGEVVTKEFAVRNADTKPFIINKVDTDCGCMATNFEKKPLQPNETSGLSISFASRGYYGYILKKVTVMTTACAKPMIFYIEAEIK